MSQLTADVVDSEVKVGQWLVSHSVALPPSPRFLPDFILNV